MENILMWIGGGLLALAALVWWKYQPEEESPLVNHPDFKTGYDAALDAYRRTLSVKKMIESHKIDREKGDCTPYEYGYACALADIADEPRPAPWGKSNA
jgi:hypothetical protein